MKKISLKWKLFLCYSPLFFICSFLQAQNWNPNYSIGSLTGVYTYNYNQTPANLVEFFPVVFGSQAGLTYQWEISTRPIDGFNTVIATTPSLSFTAPLDKTYYYRRKVTHTATGNYVYSNVVQIEVVSINWEDKNYVREHTILKPGVTDWKVVDALPIGDKLQTTTYMDGLGRGTQKVSRETATPTSGSLWGDVVQFSVYDEYGRQTKQYLPYTTTTETGKYKSAPLTEQPTYYTNKFNESSAFSEVTVYDNSPLNKARIVKSPGTNWAAGIGNQVSYELNSVADNVQKWHYDYYSLPINQGAYPANELYKTVYTDENGKKVEEYSNKGGQLILKKVQLADNPATGHADWICTYSVYDDFGLLRYRISPEGVKYLQNNGWTFTGTDGPTVAAGLCFSYTYDAKGRTIAKKAPGADELKMLYDNRDRVVFMQDGNQRVKSTPEWTANLYDELDRPIITTLYKTTKSTSQLQADITAAVNISTVTLNQPGDAIVNLVVDSRDVSIPRYAATNTIEFTSVGTTSFQSADGDEFIAEIDPAAANPTLTVSVATLGNPISSSDLNNSSVCTVLKYQFYDNYNFPGAKPFDNSFINTTAYANNGTTIVPIAKTARTLSFPTGSKVRVLNTNTFLTTTAYYDEDGQPIQSLEDNIKNGVDITTNQYHYDGRLLSSYNVHTAVGTGMVNFGTLTRHNYDKIGRILSIDKQYGTNGFKTIATYTYDDMGRLKNKTLDPGYANTTTGKNYLESLDYSYNIHNNITGINKDYALKAAGYNKWDKYFGMALGFDKTEGVFSGTNLNGQVAGTAWVTQGDDAQRKYDFTYDNAGRLSNAVFNEKKTPSDNWSNTMMDFSVSGRNGKIEYDLNGNIKYMSQKGVVIGSNSPITVDDLAYTYGAYSNKLLKVTDANTAVTNGQLGDFKGTTNTTDYVYDNNGNLVIDLNKNAKDLAAVAGANGIRYNYLDKPEEIHITGKGTIKIVYDAEGSKLQKLYTPEIPPSGGGGATTKVTTYINQFVYEQTATSSAPLLGGGGTLSYISFEEGRIRPIQAVAQNNGLDALAVTGNMVLPNGSAGAYDYYIRDYQANVRMILTEETHISSSTATMEDADANRKTYEESVFGQTGGANEVNNSRFAKPAGWQSNSSAKVSKLFKTGPTVGPNSLLKVMAGDAISATTQYYYEGATTNNNNSLATNVITSLLAAFNGSAAATAATHGASTTALSSQLNGSGLPAVADPHQYSNDNQRKAYLTVLFFDERFNYVSDGSTYQRVQTAGDNAAPLVLANIKAPKNGYAYVYVSNESDEPVYFDNLQVSHNRGRIVEENHYYAFGLKIAGISSHKLADTNEGNTDNKYLYNDKELDDEGDLNWLDYGFRNYDPQIGRFVQIDPLTDEMPDMSTYHYGYNDPIGNIDEDGLAGVGIPGQTHLNLFFKYDLPVSDRFR
jgi:RHS repeat-associated protein